MEKFVEKTRELLKCDYEEEVAEIRSRIQSESPEKCEILGLSILNLEISSISTSLFGRISVELRYPSKKLLPSTFRVGDEVCLLYTPLEPDSNGSVDGIVTKSSAEMIEVTVESIEGLESSTSTIRINKRASDVTYKKLCAALDSLSINNYHPLVQLLFRESRSEAEVLPIPERIAMRTDKYSISTLNDSQIRAIESSLSRSSLLSLIHGPPGKLSRLGSMKDLM
jgi:hypothetical protein